MNSLPRYVSNALFSLFKWPSTVLYARRNFITVSHGSREGIPPVEATARELRSCSNEMNWYKVSKLSVDFAKFGAS